MINPYRIRHNRTWAKVQLDRLTMKLLTALDRGVQPIPSGAYPVSTCFVVGCGHSGTTLLAARLGNHPKIMAIPEETSMFLQVKRRLSTARARISQALEQGADVGAACLVEKTPKHVHSVDRIRRILPDAQVIVVLRNPYDTCLSFKTRFNDLNYGIERWVIDNEAALALSGRDGVCFTFFERLTEHPDGELGRLLAFLGLEFDGAVVSAENTVFESKQHRSPNMQLRTKQVGQPIRANSGKWRTGLSKEEVRRVEAACGPLWRQLLDRHAECAPDQPELADPA